MTSESVYLVKETPDEEAPTLHSVAKFHENLLQQTSFGTFHIILLVVAGLGLIADAIQLFALGYILPSTEYELCIGKDQKGWLGMISLIGMLMGAWIWGTIGDRLGRRRTLIIAFFCNGIFGVIAAFMPTFSLLMITRFCSSFGMGGSLPIVFVYYCEFLVRPNRGRHLSFLFIFWALGGLFVTGLAWIIIPQNGAILLNTKRLQFGHWRKFILLCSVPALVSALGINFLPESPRFLLEMRRTNEALMVYKQIFTFNKTMKNREEYQLTQLKVPAVPPSLPANRDILREMLNSLEMCWGNVQAVFASPTSLLFVAVWTTMSFGFTGMSQRFQESTKAFDYAFFASMSIKQDNISIDGKIINTTMENTHFTDMAFSNVRFVQILISYCTFENCSFTNCTFSNIRTSKTYFKNCFFYQTKFLDTDLYNYKFQSCSLNSTDFYNTKDGCDIDFDINMRIPELIHKNLYSHLVALPAILISSFFLDKIGRKKIIGSSLLLSGLSVGLLWLFETTEKVLAVECVFTFLSIFGWNSLSVMSIEAFPANIRTTSAGVLTAVILLSAILSNALFGIINTASTLIICGSVLWLGCVFLTKLPETKDYIV